MVKSTLKTKSKRHSVLAAAVALPVAAVTLAACGETSAPQVGAMSQTILMSQNKSSAYLIAQYRCSGGKGTGEGPVIWASVKQTAKNNDPKLYDEGSSKIATAWYDSHTPVSCDGKSHTAIFKMDRHTNKGVFKTTVNAWLQFCLTDGAGTLATNDQYVVIK